MVIADKISGHCKLSMECLEYLRLQNYIHVFKKNHSPLERLWKQCIHFSSYMKTTTLRCEISSKFRNEIKTQILKRNFSKQQIHLVRSHVSKDWQGFTIPQRLRLWYTVFAVFDFLKALLSRACLWGNFLFQSIIVARLKSCRKEGRFCIKSHAFF